MYPWCSMDGMVQFWKQTFSTYGFQIEKKMKPRIQFTANQLVLLWFIVDKSVLLLMRIEFRIDSISDRDASLARKKRDSDAADFRGEFCSAEICMQYDNLIIIFRNWAKENCKSQEPEEAGQSGRKKFVCPIQWSWWTISDRGKSKVQKDWKSCDQIKKREEVGCEEASQAGQWVYKTHHPEASACDCEIQWKQSKAEI